MASTPGLALLTPFSLLFLAPSGKRKPFLLTSSLARTPKKPNHPAPTPAQTRTRRRARALASDRAAAAPRVSLAADAVRWWWGPRRDGLGGGGVHGGGAAVRRGGHRHHARPHIPPPAPLRRAHLPALHRPHHLHGPGTLPTFPLFHARQICRCRRLFFFSFCGCFFFLFFLFFVSFFNNSGYQ